MPLAEPSDLAAELGALGYPGFAHLRSARKVDPAGFLLTALAQRDLDLRVVEGLPWVILSHPDIDWDNLIQQAQLEGLQNRLGYLVHLAREVAESNPMYSAQAVALAAHERLLEHSRISDEDTLCRNSMTVAERKWLRQHRPAAATRWNLLTGLTAEQLRYDA